jgi:DnaJ-class molecular chaperone
MSGFVALPKAAGADWWEVLKVPRDAKRGDVEEAFKRLARERHPDRGGSSGQMAELNAARARALQEVA